MASQIEIDSQRVPVADRSFVCVARPHPGGPGCRSWRWFPFDAVYYTTVLLNCKRKNLESFPPLFSRPKQQLPRFIQNSAIYVLTGVVVETILVLRQASTPRQGNETMTILILKNETLENGARVVELAGEKKEINIYIGNSFTNVCVNNLGSNFYRGGKAFHGANTLEQAMAAYKSAEVRSMIQTAMELVA